MNPSRNHGPAPGPGSNQEKGEFPPLPCFDVFFGIAPNCVALKTLLAFFPGRF